MTTTSAAKAASAPQGFAPSKYQQAIFDFVQSGKGNAIIEAVAGSGKTTTIVRALDMIDPAQRALFLAFNKSIATELQRRVPAHVNARTLNSLGFGSCMANAPRKPQIDGNKVRKIVRDAMPKEAEHLATPVSRLVSLCKAYGIARRLNGEQPLIPFGDEPLEALADAHDIEIDSSWRAVVDWVAEILDRNNAELGVIDFDDQLYFPVIFNWPVPKYDWVFVDEAQDLSLVQRALVKKALRPGGRLVAVGDSRQAIYAFRGADSRSMAAIEQDFSCTKLPLSISYRCAKSVVAVAQEIVPWIEASDTAPDGSVREVGSYDAEEFDQADMIVCRNTAPLITMAYRLMRARIPCRIMGKDLGDGLKALVKRMKAKNIPSLLEKIFAWERRQIESAMASDKPEKAERAVDKASCIRFLAGYMPDGSVTQLLAEIDHLFSGERGVTLATVHKAKGLEAERVYILDSYLMPSRYARTTDAMLQEENLQYVAITRAKRELLFIDTDKFVG